MRAPDELFPGPLPMAAIPVGALPVGAVTAFAGALAAPAASFTAPIEAWGWMPCDGRTLATGQYPELFAALGYLYGGSGASFSIPDYRGTFLRGADNGAGKDPDSAIRTAPDGGSALNDGVGSRQQAAMLTHEHNYQSAPAMASPAGEGSAASSPAKPAQTSAPSDASGTLLTASTGVSQKETRPCNTAVNFLIKYTYGPWTGGWP